MKKKGKKLISIALTVAMIAGLTACGKGNGGNGRWISIWIQTI